MHHVSVISAAPLRVPLRAKLITTTMGGVAVILMFLSVRGWAVYLLGLPFLLVVVWSVWLIW